MGEIQEVRDRIAHYGARLEPQIGKGWISSDNLIGAREMMQVETFHFKVQDLIDMSDDL